MSAFIFPYNIENFPHLSYDAEGGYYCRACWGKDGLCPLCQKAYDKDADQESQDETEVSA